MIATFIDPIRGQDINGMAILVVGLRQTAFQTRSDHEDGLDLMAIIVESDGTGREVPWNSLTLDWRWNDKSKRWDDANGAIVEDDR